MEAHLWLLEPDRVLPPFDFVLRCPPRRKLNFRRLHQTHCYLLFCLPTGSQHQIEHYDESLSKVSSILGFGEIKSWCFLDD